MSEENNASQTPDDELSRRTFFGALGAIGAAAFVAGCNMSAPSFLVSKENRTNSRYLSGMLACCLL